MPMTTMASSSKSSFSAFKDVDESVAKPVLGSDGAARWQDFRGGVKLPASAGVAPALPLKKLDRVLGTTSIRDERAREAEVRREAGDRESGSGYTVFKRKSDHEEAAERKRKKLVLDRIRPDDAPYFLDAETFEGYKFDYVFTTRDTRGTGYYWDGMDSVKKELGQLTHVERENADDGDAEATQQPKKMRKKKKKTNIEPAVHEVDQFNPMEQISQAIARREQALQGPFLRSQHAAESNADAAALGADTSVLNMASSTSVSEPLEPELVGAGWEATKDAKTGKMYYFRRSTKERSWKKPSLSNGSVGGTGQGPPVRAQSATDNNADAAALGADSSALTMASSSAASETLDPALTAAGWESTKDARTGKMYYFRRSTNEQSWKKPSLPRGSGEQNGDLPSGWKSSKDGNTGKVYYYHTSGKTSWEKPLS